MPKKKYKLYQSSAKFIKKKTGRKMMKSIVIFVVALLMFLRGLGTIAEDAAVQFVPLVLKREQGLCRIISKSMKFAINATLN
jgi:hypothetical protein